MMTKTLTLTEFLLARIAEDEAAATVVSPLRNTYDFADNPIRGTQTATDLRSLRECEAKRRIVALANWEGDKNSIRDRILGPSADLAFQKGVEAAMRSLAAVYADHPDYDRGEWRP